MKRNQNTLTIALAATALSIFGFSSLADEAGEGDERFPPLNPSPKSVDVSVSVSPVAATHPPKGYTGRAFTPNRPVSPQAPEFVSPNPATVDSPAAKRIEVRPAGYTAHSPVSPPPVKVLRFPTVVSVD